MSYNKAPFYKGKNFRSEAMDIAINGIPKCADSVRNPKVIGTPEWRSFWESVLYKIKNGVQAGGLWIPGRYYYYLNFNSMATINGIITPDMIDFHLELAYLVEHCKKTGEDAIIAKRRRLGVSEFFQKAVIDYGYRFTPGYQGGVAAGLDVYAQDFMKKWRFGDALLPPELKLKTLLNNDNEIISGYQIKENGEYEERGSKSQIYVRTMKNNANVFKGLFLMDAIGEEFGEFENGQDFLGATNDCLKDGTKKVGNFWLYGTGGDLNKGSKAFREIWYNKKTYSNFIRVLGDATRGLRPHYGSAMEKGKDISQIPNLIKTHQNYQLIGVEDIEAARASVTVERDRLMASGDLKRYQEHLQNNPLDEKEVFRKTSVNNFDIIKLNEQDHSVRSLATPKYSKWIIDFKKNEKGDYLTPLELVPRPAKDIDPEEDCILILDDEHPNVGVRKNYANLYVAGLDSYDQDTSRTSKSLGAMCVMIRRNTIEYAMQMCPVAVIRTRPKRKEIFYEMCLKLAIYYNLVGGVLVDVRNPAVIHYFKQWGCQRFLAYRPQKFEAENSQQGHEFGVSLNTYSKPKMVSLMQSNIYDFYKNIWFQDLIEELGNYDVTEVDSDNDLADAYGIALMQDVSMDLQPEDQDFKYKEDPFELPSFAINKDGDLVEGYDFPELPHEQDHAGFGHNR